MNTRIQMLLIIAAVQLILVGFLLIFDGQSNDAEGPWISFDRGSVTSLEIADSDESVVLNLAGEEWVIDGLPADADKIDNLLDKLVELKAPWPVATSSDAIDRFEVGDDNFQRQLIVSGESGSLLDLFLGTSPGYQRVHARKSSESDVFSVALSNYELPANTDGWLDKALLTVSDDPTQIVASLAKGETVLTKSEEGWLVDGKAADQDAATTYANRFKTLRVLGVYRGDKTLVSQGEIKLGQPTELEIEIMREDVSEDASDQEGEYVVRTPRFARTFRLSNYIAEQLLMTDVDFAVTENEVEEVEEVEEEEGHGTDTDG